MELKGLGAVGHVQPVLPANYGQWSGTVGNSNWVYDLTAQRWDMATGTLSAWGAMIARTLFPHATRTAFANSFPNFSPVIVMLTCPGDPDLYAQYTYPPGQQLSGNRAQNMNTADWWVANHFHCTVGSVTSMRSANRFTWHEMEDLRHIILVPWEIHGNVHHSGGIEVVNAGGIGARKNDFSDLENRRFGGELLYRMGNTWVTKNTLRADGALREVECTYICDDPGAGPAEQQRAARQALEQRWEALAEEVWPSVAAYVQSLDTEAVQGGGWQAAPQEIIVYPPDLEGHVETGILYEFSGDREHGIGVRLRDGEIMYVGHGDAAL